MSHIPDFATYPSTCHPGESRTQAFSGPIQSLGPGFRRDDRIETQIGEQLKVFL